MKFRSGFVSNSSSSSFCIFGVCLDSSEILKLLNKSEDEDYYIDDLIDEALKTPMGYYRSPWGDNYYIGKSWSDVKDDETGLQFKTRVKNELKEVFGENLDFGTYQEAWFDG